MSEREYIVTLHKNVDYKKFDAEMISSTGSGAIPCRCVDIANARPGSHRNTHYMLTDAEAEILKSDPRVMGVEIPPNQRNDIVIVRRAIQFSDFTKTTLDRGFFVNWGLRRVNESVNPYNGVNVTGGYNYTLDGTGVDIVIQDSGIQADHPEFQDSQGISRVQQIDWYTASGLPGSMPVGHYIDYDGHGTHVAGIAAGKTYGWAKNARIYAVKIQGLEGPTDPNSGIPITDIFDVIKEWHNNKPIDPNTGTKRPTIVNMSWGYAQRYDTVSEIVYRGTSYTGTSIDSSAERASFGLLPTEDAFSFITNVRIPSIDADVQELIDAGVHICIAAGNRSHKIDVLSGSDYNNYAVTTYGTITSDSYYHRGSSPFDDEAHIVGNIDSVEHIDGLEQKADSSETGPGVSIYAPGTDIMSATSTINTFIDGDYPENTNYKICNISGTSMAAPQVVGVLSLWLQLNPAATPAQAKAFLETIAQQNQIYLTGNSTDYTNFRSLCGGNNRYLFNKFNSATQLRLGGGS